MYENFNLFSFLLGLPLAIVITIIILFTNRRIGKKKRWFDERYTKIHENARSVSWIVTTITLLVVWMIIIILEGPGLSFFLITGIWVIHMASYAIGAAVASKNY